MTLSIYDTATLVQVVRNLKRPSQFLLDTFFPNLIEYTTKEFAIDVDAGKRRLAPFVSPLMQGKPVESRGITTTLFAPAYIKDKRGLDPFRPVMRAIGERIGGDLTPVEREMANLQYEMEDQVQMIDRRLEWMAASELQTGAVTIAGDGYPTQFVNFQRDASLTVALAAGAKWTAGNVGTPTAPGAVRPSQNIDAWGAQVLQMSGAVVSDVVFTPSAWNASCLIIAWSAPSSFPRGTVAASTSPAASRSVHSIRACGAAIACGSTMIGMSIPTAICNIPCCRMAMSSLPRGRCKACARSVPLSIRSSLMARWPTHRNRGWSRIPPSAG